MDFKSGLREKPELIKVYEKISRGIWSYKGFFELIDASAVSDGKRKVFKFSLKPVKKKAFGRIVELPHNRLIPTAVKVEVWRRDGGKCVQCGSTKNLHFDHDIPFSKGGSSLTAANVRLLCAKHNLEKSDKHHQRAPLDLKVAQLPRHRCTRHGVRESAHDSADCPHPSCKKILTMGLQRYRTEEKRSWHTEGRSTTGLPR